MEFTINEGKETRVTLKGKLDYSSAPPLMKDLEALKDKGAETIVFGCAELTYISSSGIRVFIFAKQKINGNMVVIIEDASDEITEVLEICGLSDYVEFRQSQ